MYLHKINVQMIYFSYLKCATVEHQILLNVASILMQWEKLT